MSKTAKPITAEDLAKVRESAARESWVCTKCGFVGALTDHHCPYAPVDVNKERRQLLALIDAQARQIEEMGKALDVYRSESNATEWTEDFNARVDRLLAEWKEKRS